MSDLTGAVIWEALMQDPKMANSSYLEPVLTEVFDHMIKVVEPYVLKQQPLTMESLFVIRIRFFQCLDVSDFPFQMVKVLPEFLRGMFGVAECRDLIRGTLREAMDQEKELASFLQAKQIGDKLGGVFRAKVTLNLNAENQALFDRDLLTMEQLLRTEPGIVFLVF